MIKEYKYRAFYRVLFLAIMIIGIYSTIDFGKSFGFVITIILDLIFLWLALFVLRLKIVVTDKYILGDIGRLGKRIERNWDKIDRISRIPFSFLRMYKIHCKDKPSLMFSNAIDNYIDLLEEIIKRSPNAIVDDSVIKFLEKAQNKKHQ